MDYEKQAEDFMNECSAKMDIMFVGCMPNCMWDDKESRNRYSVTITTPKGKMNLDFWDSLNNTWKFKMAHDKDRCARNMYGRYYEGLSITEKARVRDRMRGMEQEGRPTYYDILACLESYDPGTFKDFCSEFGYSDDSIKAFKIYTACQEQYADLCRIFTPEQMDKLREIR